jgi:hypothetical protein
MKTKSILIIFFLGISYTAAYAQDKAVCKKIVSTTIEAVNNKPLESIEALFSADFTCAGQKAQIAVMVFKQLLSGVSDYKPVGETADNNELTLVYEITSEQLGKREASFIFNTENKLKQLDLAGVATKTMKSDATQVETGTKEIITVPVQLSENNMLIAEAKINGKVRKFIIDSGAPSLILNSKHAKSEKADSIKNSAALGAQGVNSSISGMDITKIPEFDLYGIKIKNQDVLTMDLSHLERALGIEIYGLIGYQVYKDYDMLFDYENNTVVFIQPDHTSDYLKNNYNQNTIAETPIEMRQHIPYVQGTIENQTLTFGIDNGAGSNLISESFWELLKKQVKNVETAELKGAGESRDVKSGILKEIIIGNKKFENTQTVFNDISHLNTGKEASLDGLIGYEILSKQKTLLSFRNKRLLFID